jgi:hypothetical protein
MKITNQTADDLALKEGDAKAIVVGATVFLVGVIVMFYAHFIPSTALWVAIGLCIVGLITVLVSSSIAVDMNRSTGQITYQTKRLIGGRTTSYAIGDVLRIETRKSWRMEGGQQTGNVRAAARQVLVSQSVIVFKDGQELPLDHQNNGSSLSIDSGVMMSGSGKEVAIANQVATFLGVPFQEIAPPGGSVGINIGGGTGIQL